MNVVCPNCGCAYDINPDILPKSTGNERFGYGWWLKCYKCQNKWWLKNSDVEQKINDPFVEEEPEQVNPTLKYTSNVLRPQKSKLKKILFYIFCVFIICLAVYKKDVFYDYLADKNKKISSNMLNNIAMEDVKYFIGTENNECKMTVKGKIVNKESSVIRINGVQIFVYDMLGNKIKSWSYPVEYGYIVSGDYIEFSTSENLEKNIEKIKVDVSIF